MERGRKILLLEQDQAQADEISRFLKIGGNRYELIHSTDIAFALEQFSADCPDALLVGEELAKLDAYKPLQLLSEQKHVPVILLSPVNSRPAAGDQKYGATVSLVRNKLNLVNLPNYIANSIQLKEIDERLQEVYAHLDRQNESLRQVFNYLRQGVIVLAADSQLSFINETACCLLNTPPFAESLRPMIQNYRGTPSLRVTLDEQRSYELREFTIEWQSKPATLFLIDAVNAGSDIDFKTYCNLLQHSGQASVILKDGVVKFSTATAQRDYGCQAGHNIAAYFKEATLESSNRTLPFLTALHSYDARLTSDETRVVNIASSPAVLSNGYYRVLHLKPVQQAIAEKRNAIDVDRLLTVASHDLREPVRVISSFVQMAADKINQGGKSEEAIEYLQFIKESSGKLDKMLTDLKTYVNLDTRSPRKQKVNTREVVQGALKRLQKEIDEAGMTIELAQLPDTRTDGVLLGEMIYQLADNAIRFRKTEHPELYIGAQTVNSKVHILFRDNGPGIAAEYLLRVFDMFEKFDANHGSGMGLTICKKISDMLHADIQIASFPGAGTQVLFALDAC